MPLKSTRMAILCFVLIGSGAFAQQGRFRLAVPPSFAGPDAVETLLSDGSPDWSAWKRELKVNHGLSFGFDYSAVFLSANDVSANDTAAGGIARAYGMIEPIRNGALIFKVEQRHSFGQPAPANLAANELGYAGVLARPFNDSEFGTHNLYWRQRMNGGRSTLIVGVLDPTDYVDSFALASPWKHFMNQAFSTGSAAIGLPNDAAFGVAYGSMLNSSMYIIAGITDVNGDPSDPFKGFDNFFSDNDYFASFEFGWTSSNRRVIFDNLHFTAWHKDGQTALQTSSGYGLAFSLSNWVTKNLMPFVRGGYAKDGGSLLEKSLSIGLGYQTGAFDGFLGAALNWGDPNENTFAQGLQDQYALEVFYRLPFGNHFSVTGDVQYIKDPALNPIENTIWMLNLRARASF